MAFDWKLEYNRYQRYFVDLRSLYKHRKVVVYTGITLTILAVSFFSLFALKPTVTTVLSLIKEIQQKRVIDQKLQTKINALKSAQANLSAAGSSLRLVDDALPVNAHLSQVIYHLEYLAQQENINLSSIGFEPVVLFGQKKDASKNVKQKEISEIYFSLSASGDFENLKRFLQKIEILRRVVVIDSFTLNSNQLEKTITINLSAAGRAFYLPKEEEK